MNKQFCLINAIVCGHVLAILAVVLNAFAAVSLNYNFNLSGVVLGVLAILCAYIQWTLFVGVHEDAAKTMSLHQQAALQRKAIKINRFGYVVVALTVLSYLSWLISFNS